MAIQRRMLDWSKPALPQVADYLLAAAANAAAAADLSRHIVALPGARAGRRLLEILVEQADKRQRMLYPPRIVTIGQLPELLYRAQKPFASHFVQRLAWAEAIRRCDVDACRHLLPQDLTADDLPTKLALGALLGKLHRELAAEMLDFSVVAQYGEKSRWDALAEVQKHYLHILDELALWDKQTARLYAVRQGECHIDAQIVLVGLIDLNRTQRMMLDQVAEQVTSLVFASPEDKNSDRFDDLGCLCPEAWQNVKIPLDANRIEVVNSPADQAAAVVRQIAAYEGRYSAADIIIGVPDDHVVPPLRQQLEQCGLRGRYGGGVPLSRTGPYRLLAVVADYLDSSRFTGLAALVRHPAMDPWLTAQGVASNWLTAMDEYYHEHLPHDLDEKWLGAGTDRATLVQVSRAVEELVCLLRGGPRPLSEWNQRILDVLINVLDQGELDRTKEPDHTVLLSCQQIREVLDDHSAVPASLMPSLDGAQAIRMVLSQLETTAAPPLPDHEAIELLGWLELPLDDAPAMIITGLNEGLIPSSINSDLFLPNQLRQALKIADNKQRLARDTYALSLLVAVRPDLRVIAGRRSTAGDPLTPSRLLFACEDAELAQRVQRFFQERSPAASGVMMIGTMRAGGEHSMFVIPPPVSLKQRITSMRVTEFRDYLACPYRYYLRHPLKLKSVADAAEELDGGGFGSLAHEVLAQFGSDAIRESADEKEVNDFFNKTLDRRVKELFPSPLPAVLVQIEQLRIRLQALARWQAEWVAQGWVIEHVEAEITHDAAAMIVDDEPMYLRGRIDRIDVHQATGRRIVFDYKTSDSADGPEQTHGRKSGQKNEWKDLQLPLYRHLVTALGIRDPENSEALKLGYILLPKDVSQVGARMAEWTAADLADADHTAAEVIRGVRAERFWPPTSPPPAFSEDFSAICQDGRFGATMAGEDEEDEEEQA